MSLRGQTKAIQFILLQVLVVHRLEVFLSLVHRQAEFHKVLHPQAVYLLDIHPILAGDKKLQAPKRLQSPLSGF
jgi:hypothetical protein